MDAPPNDPHRPPTPEAVALSRALLSGAAHAALATVEHGRPLVTRIGCLWLPGAGMGMLLSDLSDHSRALAADPSCALLVGDPGGKGDPLTHPRLTLRGTARPKATLYYDFTDFRLLALVPDEALLNGGFGKAHRLAPADL
jgi:putative heme iron utilization protein